MNIIEQIKSAYTDYELRWDKKPNLLFINRMEYFKGIKNFELIKNNIHELDQIGQQFFMGAEVIFFNNETFKNFIWYEKVDILSVIKQENGSPSFGVKIKKWTYEPSHKYSNETDALATRSIQDDFQELLIDKLAIDSYIRSEGINKTREHVRNK